MTLTADTQSAPAPITIPRYREVEFAAELMSTSRAAVYAYHADGLFPPGITTRVGRRLLFHEQRLIEWLAAGGTASTVPTGWSARQREARASKAAQRGTHTVS